MIKELIGDMSISEAKENGENLWNELDDCKWYTMPSLGPKWLGKWTYSNNGYTLIASDGIDIWGEKRNTDYIQEKAQEWAVCLECGVPELSELVLSQLKEKESNLQIHHNNLHNEMAIYLTASLDPFPYNWVFYLSKLPHEVIEHHWTWPVSVTLEFMSERILKLEDELKRRITQLEELLPPKSITRKDTDVIITSCLEAAVQKVSSQGIGIVLCNHFSRSTIINQMTKKRKVKSSDGSDRSQLNSRPHNRPRAKIKRPAKGVSGQEEEDPFERRASQEEEKRSQIEALTQTDPSHTSAVKKKRILNI